MLAVSACSSSNNNDETKPPSGAASSAAETPTPSSTDPEAAAKDELLAAYQQYLDEVTKSYSQAGTEGTDIKKYATGAALVTVQSETKAMHKAGQITTGKPGSTPEVTAINLSRKVPNATITDCMDVSQWKLVDQKTKNVVELPKERLTKYVDVISVEKWGKQWVVLKETPQDRKC
ncbi:hypothetical protein ACFXI6_18045 [Streptomyces mirabilis]|uniref:hypothetical protein n=1 Tax=Streptomyces mirabilis TaxID=68239 RepID=UPI003681668E